MIGCPTCQADLDHKGCGGELCCSVEDGLMEPTNNDPESRTWDPHGQSSNPDQHKYNPWRAPGMAPVIDPCGIASGGQNPNAYSAVPAGYEAAAKGSEVLPETEATLWQAGSTATVGWALSAQHSGGYSYRLCPKDSDLTEACFQSNTLTFAGNSSIHWNDDSQADKKIVTRTYVAPDGTQWRTNPIPACVYEQWPIRGSATPDCSVGTMFEPGFDEFTQGYLRPGNSGKNKFSVMDEVNVPNKPGKYVLGWRWDCEEADQVWNSCADIEIVDHSVPVPEPPSHDADGTCPDFVPGVDSCSSNKGCMTRDASGNCLECCSGCWWMYNSKGNTCNGGKKPTPTPTPSPSPSPSPSGSCASRQPEKQYDCYYEGCKTGTSDSCEECCDGCHLESDPSKGTYCMEDKVLFTV